METMSASAAGDEVHLARTASATGDRRSGRRRAVHSIVAHLFGMSPSCVSHVIGKRALTERAGRGSLLGKTARHRHEHKKAKVSSLMSCKAKRRSQINGGSHTVVSHPAQ